MSWSAAVATALALLLVEATGYALVHNFDKVPETTADSVLRSG